MGVLAFSIARDLDTSADADEVTFSNTETSALFPCKFGGIVCPVRSGIFESKVDVFYANAMALEKGRRSGGCQSSIHDAPIVTVRVVLLHPSTMIGANEENLGVVLVITMGSSDKTLSPSS